MKRIQLALAAILFASLALYGWAQQTRPGLTPAEESRIALERHEAKIIAQLNLTKKQKTDYDKLQAWVKSESAGLATMTSGQVEAGKQINRKMHEGLKSIFTPAQYTKYLHLWEPTPLKFQDPMATGSPFGGTDEAILNELKLTSAQWSQYREFNKELEVKNNEFRELSKTDPKAAGFKGSETNRWIRASMRKILSEDQYYEWIYRWDEVMSPYLANGAKLNGKIRSATGGGGEVRPIAGKTGG